jgi:hypothetical protein
MCFSVDTRYLAITLANGPPTVAIYHLDREGPRLAASKIFSAKYGPFTDMYE